MDGHRGLKNEKVNEHSTAGFQLVLSALENDPQSFTFVVHATSNIITIGSPFQPFEFLQRIGYAHFKGECPFHREKCFWRPLAVVGRAPFADRNQVEMVHAAFKAHAGRIQDLYETMKQIIAKLGLPDSQTLDLFPELREVEVPVFEPGKDSIPDWAATQMPDRFATVTKEIGALQREAHKLRSIAGLLWQTGDALEEGVTAAFSDMGLKALKNQPGATYDITVELGSNRRLLVEVTGIAGHLKKDTNKIGQAFQAVQKDAQPGDRVVVAVNAYRDRSLDDRQGLEIVTPDALGLMTRMGVNVVATAALFGIWKASLSNQASARARIDALHAQDGGLFQ